MISDTYILGEDAIQPFESENTVYSCIDPLPHPYYNNDTSALSDVAKLRAISLLQETQDEDGEIHLGNLNITSYSDVILINAFIEKYQDEDGNIDLEDHLKDYNISIVLDGLDKIRMVELLKDAQNIEQISSLGPLTPIGYINTVFMINLLREVNDAGVDAAEVLSNVLNKAQNMDDITIEDLYMSIEQYDVLRDSVRTSMNEKLDKGDIIHLDEDPICMDPEVAYLWHKQQYPELHTYGEATIYKMRPFIYKDIDVTMSNGCSGEWPWKLQAVGYDSMIFCRTYDYCSESPVPELYGDVPTYDNYKIPTLDNDNDIRLVLNYMHADNLCSNVGANNLYEDRSIVGSKGLSCLGKELTGVRVQPQTYHGGKCDTGDMSTQYVCQEVICPIKDIAEAPREGKYYDWEKSNKGISLFQMKNIFAPWIEGYSESKWALPERGSEEFAKELKEWREAGPWGYGRSKEEYAKLEDEYGMVSWFTSLEKLAQ